MKKIFTFITIISLGIGCFTGCGRMENSENTGMAGQTAQGTADDIYTVKYVAPGNEFADQDYVIEQVNKRLLTDGLKIQIELVRIPWDVWDQKTNLMLSTGEEIGLIHVMQDVKAVSVLKSQNAIIPLNDYIDKYPNLKNALDTAWGDFTVKGEILAVPAMSGYNISKDYGRIYYQQEVFDKTGAEIPETVDEVIDTALKMQEVLLEETGKKTYTWTHQLSAVPDWLHRTYDNAPFTVENTMGLVKIDQDGTVSSWYESEEFKKDCETYKKMYDLGLVDPDVLTVDRNRTTTESLNGRFIFGFDTFNYGSTEKALKENTGNTLTDFVLNEELGNYRFFSILNGNAIPSSCKNPEASIQFLDWLYGDAENFRLFMYGEEGRNYKKIDETTAEFFKGEDGNYLYNYDNWQIGYVEHRLFEEGMSGKLMEIETQPMSGKITVSPIIGFQFDQTGVINEIANLQTEIITSIYPIKYGVADYETNIDAAIVNLKAAGLDKVIAEYAKQLNDFMGK